MPVDRGYQLEHRYTRESGRVYLTGVQALVRLPMEQRRRDRAAGLTTAGFVSGYRGSPLGTYDMALWSARELLERHDVRFEPGVNEDLAATAVWGTQQATLHAGAKVDGVFGIWYGKGPGVDRSCDALKHANYAGTAPRGGVLALCGDDPAARSSSIAHQSEQAFVHCAIPVLNPSSVQEYLDFGLYGFALSRFAGSWVAMKCLTDTVDSARSVDVGADRVRIATPTDFALPPGGLSIRWANLPLEVERRVHQQRLPAAQAFVRANGLDRTAVSGGARPRLGIVTAGKAYLDVRQALEDLGLDERRCAEIGLAVYKVAMVWPLEPEGARRFCAGLEDVLVVEEKRSLLEDQLARILYDLSDRPRLLGKRDERGAPLVPAEGELAPGAVAEILRAWIACRVPELARVLPPRPESLAGAPAAGGPMRLPSFCSGCPHNTSTVVPDGSIALGGIGCHGMAVWMPERRTLAVTQMGGEGANWIGQAPYVDTPHVFQNVGDGTYFHSALLAIRAACAANVNITYKVLVNGAVAMTGGQPIEGEPILDGAVTVPEVARQLEAEGVRAIAVVSDAPDKYGAGARFPAGVTFHHRDELDRVQKRLRETPGVTAIVYDQSCAAEARRLRKQGTLADPDARVVINELVCEGCGDCSVQSNCISIAPVETEFGRKRRIDQSSCNKDYSCLKGYCPSFVTVHGGQLRTAGRGAPGPPDRRTGGDAVQLDDSLFASLPEPAVADLAQPWNVLVTGIGGSGVVTVGALVGMAAHLEGKGVSTLDVTGLAQKNGPVTSHVRVAARPDDLFATRIAAGGADLVIGADVVVTAGAESLLRIGKGRTHAVVNRHVAPTADFATNPDLDLSSARMEQAIRAAAGDEGCHFFDATALATALLGDALGTNLFLLGYAAQRGLLPVSLAALERAIELNGRAVAMNRRALAWGRLAAHDLAAVERAAQPALRGAARAEAPTLDELVARRAEFLTAYQNAAWARRYRALVERVAARERERCGPGATPLAEAVARYAFKLMSYKDEYEVARLYTDGSFRAQLEREFESWERLEIQLAPQIANSRDPDTGRARKRSLGAWMFAALAVLARLKFLRGTPFDPFGWTAHRKLERRLVAEYEATVAELCDGLTPANRDVAVEIARIPEHIRGFDLVKERHLEEASARQRELLAQLRAMRR
ncbi:MAG: indolepyruvate ferredoxin oxidoreductase family protein [Proteobacteria bacterium]|nr:MAG: indolepyruvate ferredoxin oxidoreductase family protein [Pseudomonadota bacterium]